MTSIGPETLSYEVKVTWDEQAGAEVTTPRGITMKMNLPTEFGGLERYLCPDELLLSAIGGSLLMTFLHFTNQYRLRPHLLQASVHGSSHLIGPEGYRMDDTEVKMRIRIQEAQREIAERCAELAKQYCPIVQAFEKSMGLLITIEIETTHE